MLPGSFHAVVFPQSGISHLGLEELVLFSVDGNKTAPDGRFLMGFLRLCREWWQGTKQDTAAGL